MLYSHIYLPVPGTSAVFRLDDQYIIKFFPSFLINDDKTERIAHAFLSSHSMGLEEPFTGTVETFGQTFPYIIMPIVKGLSLKEAEADLADAALLKSIFEEAGRWMKRLHSLSLKEMAVSSHKEIKLDIADSLMPVIKKALEKLSFLNAEAIWPELEQFLEKQIHSVRRSTGWCLTHGDLTPEHIFIKNEKETYKFAAVIDWGDAKIAPPLYDFVTLWLILCNRKEEWFQSFLEGYDEGNGLSPLNRDELVAMIFIHPFRADLIREAWEQDDNRPYFHSWRDLLDWLQPGCDT